MTTLALTGENEEYDLVLRATAGDADAFGELYGRYYARVYRHIYYIVNDTYTAEDLASHTFLKAWEAIDHFVNRGVNSFIAWLIRIAHNKALDYVTRERSHGQLDDNMMERKRNCNPEDVVLQLEDETLVRDAVDTLRGDKRKLVDLRFYKELDYQETASALGRTVAATRVFQCRTLADLRKLLS